MDITLHLDQHCIETGAKKAYEKRLRRYFDKQTPEREKRTIENEIEGLKFFLENADFGLLRSRYPELLGKRKASVTLKLSENRNDVRIISNGVIIDPGISV